MGQNNQDSSADIVPIGNHHLIKRSSSLVQRGLESLEVDTFSGLIRVLIVDDIKETRENIRRRYETADDIEVVGEATNGEEAVELYARLIPDVVCMNINMPVMDGITATGIICKKYKDARIFILSVQSEADYMKVAMEAGALDFVAKPPSIGELIQVTRALNDKKKTKHQSSSFSKLHTFYDNIAELISNGLLSSVPGDSIRVQARILTQSSLRGLLGVDKGKLLQHLYKFNLIDVKHPIIDLSGADFTWLILAGLSKKKLDLTHINLKGANLKNARFCNVDFSNSNLCDVILEDSSLWGSIFRNTIMERINLQYSRVLFSDFQSANLHNGNLRWADLTNSDLRNADLMNANLSDSGLDNANFTNAIVTNVQLRSARSLHGTIFPDGTVHR